MTDRPILFSAPMIQALFAGRKTQTRRTIKLPKWSTEEHDHVELDDDGTPMIICKDTGCFASIPIRFAKGDRLWVREAFRFDPGGTINDAAGGQVDYVEPHYVYRGDAKPGGWKPGIHMPRAASRLTLTVTDVRVQRLQEISEADAKAEGIFFTNYGRKCGHTTRGWTDVGDCPAPPETHPQRPGWMWSATTGPDHCLDTAHYAYANLWEHINGLGSWNINPWVVALTFTVEQRNIDA